PMIASGACVAAEDTGGRVLYHGTDLASAQGLASGEPLDAAAAAVRSGGAEPGFYLATNEGDAEYFGALKSGLAGSLGVIRYTFSRSALDSLLGSNSVLEDIPVAGAKVSFEGQQLFVPLSDFELFNRLRALGEITP
ncbi:MAG TPA: hypothetical protein VI455_00330, partial [Terriglobia bacterium]